MMLRDEYPAIRERRSGALGYQESKIRTDKAAIAITALIVGLSFGVVIGRAWGMI